MGNTRLEGQGSPTGLKRWFLRAPIGLYRARLGFLFGNRFLMLEHVGRKSGQTRRTVLEVVVNRPDAVFVAAGWGAKAQWFANLKANPQARYHLGSKVYDTDAVVVDQEEAARLMAEYADSHPKALDRLSKFILDDPPDTPKAQAEAVAAVVPLVKLPKG